MLPRSRRLRTSELNVVMQKGRAFHSSFFILRVLLGVPDGYFKLSAVAPQKIFKSAVARNKERRRIYEAVRPLVADAAPNAHAMLIAKKPEEEAAFDAIKADIRSLFVKAGLLK
ncbi:MAG: ribonuclease P protein component [Patescibacteria group bacterium]|nr:ribonuclease P protein component [Patescibacteria group bacterium]MDE1967075.1 ribonuclease P protein component [Patescibacteria group bacterium]